MKKQLFFIFTSLTLIGSMQAMEQEKPNKRQKVEEAAQPLHKPPSLRNACFDYIGRNNAHPCVQNDTMAILANPNIADHSLKHELIKQLQPAFIDTYETNLVELITHNQLSEQNQALLISKLPAQVIDEQLSDLIFDNARSDAVRALLIARSSPVFIENNNEKLRKLFVENNTPYKTSCALFSRIPRLQKIDNIIALAQEGPITPKIAEIAAQQFDGQQWAAFVTKQLYHQDTLAHGNEQLFTQAHMQKFLDEIHRLIVDKQFKNASSEDLAHSKLYGSHTNDYQVKLHLVNSRVIATITKDEQRICQYDCNWYEAENESEFELTKHIVSIDPSEKYCAVLHILGDLTEQTIDIIRLADSKKLVSFQFDENMQCASLAWSADGKRIIVSNEDYIICKTLSSSHKLIYSLMNLKEIIINRFSLFDWSLKVGADQLLINLKEMNMRSQEALTFPTIKEDSSNKMTDELNKFIDQITIHTYKEIKAYFEKMYNTTFNQIKENAHTMRSNLEPFRDFGIDETTIEAMLNLINKVEQFEKEDQQNQ